MKALLMAVGIVILVAVSYVAPVQAAGSCLAQDAQVTAYNLPAYQVSGTYNRILLTLMNISANDPMRVDHTYACVSGRGCFSVYGGGTSGGSQVTSGRGDGTKSTCIGLYPFSYGRSGVCHQHTNRILFTSGRTLTSVVRGLGLSTQIWGITGNKNPSSSNSFQTCANACGLRMSLATN